MVADDAALAHARSLLFVPGSRPERYDKAAASGADLVVLDLEDAVPPDQKEAALRHVVAWLQGGRRAVVRINGIGTSWHAAEVQALAELPCDLMVPKAEDAGALTAIGGRIAGRILALVETARGVRDLEAIAATSTVARLALGTLDLAAELGVDPSLPAALAYSRGRMVVASASAGLSAPVDGVTTAIDDPDLLVAETRQSRALGFGGKLCIHPRQVSLVHEAFRPTEDEVRWAERVLAMARDGLGVLDGAMVDAPVIARAGAILARAAVDPPARG